ncbi:eCIS core domain-containing protein [Modestobacter sp. URMC 112]
MRGHEHETEGEPSLRPKAARLDGALPGPLVRAAVGGRPDLLDGPTVLGLQRAAGNRATGALLEDDRSPVHDVVGSGGAPLAPDVRADMESRLGHDFSGVRVHTDSRAHESAQAVGAHAYTVGSDVVFQRDRYDPSSTAGRITLAHELTHVVQQRQGAVDGTPAPGGIRVSDPADRFEREAAATADRVMAEPAPAPVVASPAAPALQREEAPAEEEKADEGEAPVQGLFVQREEAPEEDEESGGGG